MCTTSGAVFDGYKRMLERKKQYTEPAGKKKWSDGGQAVSSCLNRQLRPVDTPGHLYRLACTKQKTSLPLRRAERSVCLSKDGASGLGKYLGHDLPAVRALPSGRGSPHKRYLPQKSAGTCARCTDSGADFCECKQRLGAVHAAPRGCAFPRPAV